MFYQQLKQACKDKGTTVTATLKQIGIGAANGTYWKNGSVPASDIVVKLAEFLNVSTDYLLIGKDKEKNSTSKLLEDELELLTYYKKLETIDKGKLQERAKMLVEAVEERKKQLKIQMTTTRLYEYAAGAGISVPFSEDDHYIYRDFPVADVPSNADCGLYVNGTSMEPKYPDGCIVWVKQTQDIHYGDTAIFILNGAPYLKIYDKSGLVSLSPNYATIKIGEDDRCDIFGKVIGYYVE